MRIAKILSTLIIGYACVATANAAGMVTLELCVLNKTDRFHFLDAHVSAQVTELGDRKDTFREDDIVHTIDTDNYLRNKGCVSFGHEIMTAGFATRYTNDPVIKFELTGDYYLKDEHKTRAFSPVTCSAQSGLTKNSLTAVVTANDAGDLQCTVEVARK